MIVEFVSAHLTDHLKRIAIVKRSGTVNKFQIVVRRMSIKVGVDVTTVKQS